MFTGCAAVSRVVSASLQKPTVTFQNLHLQDFSFEEVTMDFEFLVKNPNNLGVTLSSLDYALDLDGRSVAKGLSKRGVELKAGETAPVRLPLTITFKDFVDNIGTFFSSKSEVPYAIAAGFGVVTPVGEVRVPINHDGNLPLPKVPDIKIADVRLAKMALTGAKIEFQVSVKNRSGFPIIPKGLNYDLSLAGVGISKGSEQLPSLGAQATETITLPLELSFLKLGTAVVNAVRTKKLPYAVKGDLDLGVFQQPFHLAGTAAL